MALCSRLVGATLYAHFEISHSTGYWPDNKLDMASLIGHSPVDVTLLTLNPASCGHLNMVLGTQVNHRSKHTHCVWSGPPLQHPRSKSNGMGQK